VIVSNWASWAELLWLAFRQVHPAFLRPLETPDSRCRRTSFDPIFVLPVAPNPSATPTPAATTGRHTGTGSAALKTLSVPPTPLAGFHTVPLLRLLVLTGYTPASYGVPTASARTLEEIRREARARGKAVVVFPECTTSNGRGILKFARGVFGGESVPVRGYGVWIMCVRYVALHHHSRNRGWGGNGLTVELQVRPADAYLALTNTLNPLSLGTHLHPRLLPRAQQEHVHPSACTI